MSKRARPRQATCPADTVDLPREARPGSPHARRAAGRVRSRAALPSRALRARCFGAAGTAPSSRSLACLPSARTGPRDLPVPLPTSPTGMNQTRPRELPCPDGQVARFASHPQRRAEDIEIHLVGTVGRPSQRVQTEIGVCVVGRQRDEIPITGVASATIRSRANEVEVERRVPASRPRPPLLLAPSASRPSHPPRGTNSYRRRRADALPRDG